MEDTKIYHKFWQLSQIFQDKVIIYRQSRWMFSLCLLILYLIRIIVIRGFYVVTYCLAIFILNQFLLFITPLKADIDDEYSDNPVLPVRSNGEFRPFLRKLNEFKFWRNITAAQTIALLCTLSAYFNIPVSAPVLVLYFIVLFIVTMRRQITHMMKHGYIPFDMGKETYKGKQKG